MSLLASMNRAHQLSLTEESSQYVKKKDICRIKSCYGLLPVNAIEKCLEISGISINDVDLVVAPGITYKDQHERISDFLRHYFGHVPQLEIIHHQVAHLATAFYGSGLEEALCLSLDAAGDEASGAIAYATRKNGIKVIEYIPTNNSLGYFYTLMTYFLGFVDGDEYKGYGPCSVWNT